MSPQFRRTAWPIVAVVFLAAIAAATALQWRHRQTRRALQRVASSNRIANGVRTQVATAFLLRSRLDGGDVSVDTSQIPGAMQRAHLLLSDWLRGRAGSRGVPTVVALPASPLRDAVGQLAVQVTRFDSLLQIPGGAGRSVRLRSAYADVSALADSIDLLVIRDGVETVRRDDQRQQWALTVLAGTIVSLGLLFALLWVRWSAADRDGIRAQQALAESERRFRLLTEQLPVGVFRNASDGQVDFVNAMMERIFGVPSAQLCGHGWLAYVHPDDRDRVVRERADARSSGVDFPEFAFRLRRGSDGALREIILRARYLRNAAGEVQSAIGIVEDVTERRALEAQLVQSQKMEAVGRLAGGVAHDFNNLLTVIGGITELVLLDPQLSDTVRQDLVEVHDAAERARTLTRQLLTLSRQQRIHVTAVPVEDVLTRTAALLRRVLGEHINVRLDVRTPGLVADADAGAIEQILLNLAVNARDAMPSGGSLRITLDATDTDPAPLLEHGHGGSWVIITVADSGSGIPAELLPRVFEPFFTTKEAGHGTGLGLAMVQSLAAQMRGGVTAHSTPGSGSTFCLFLPASASVAGPASQASTVDLPTARGIVLLVEDNAPLRRVAARALRGAQYIVLEAGDAIEARQQYHAHGGRIDGVVTDVVMPGDSGPTLVRSLRALRPELPVLYITGFSNSEQLVRDVDAGTPLLAKPFDLRDLVAAVVQLLTAGAAAPPAATPLAE